MSIERSVGIGLTFEEKTQALNLMIEKLTAIDVATKKQYKLNLSGANDLNEMAKNSSKFDKLALALKSIENVDLSKLGGGLGSKAFKKSISELNSFFATGMKDMNIAPPKDLLKSVGEIEKIITKLDGLKYENVKKNLKGFVDSIKSIDMNGLNIGKDIQSSMGKLSMLMNSMKKMEGLSSGKVDTNLKSLGVSLISLSKSLSIMEKDGIKSISSLVRSLKSLEKIDIKKIYGNLNAFKRVVNGIEVNNPELAKLVDNLKDIKNVKGLQSITSHAAGINKTSSALGGLTSRMLAYSSVSAITRRSVSLIRGEFADLEKAVYDLGIVSDMSIGQINTLKGELIDMATHTSVNAKEIAEAINMISRTGKLLV